MTLPRLAESPIRIVCLPAEKSVNQTTTNEYIRLRGLSEEQIAQVGCVFGQIVHDTYSNIFGVSSPDRQLDIIKRVGKPSICRPLCVYERRLDRTILDRSSSLLSFYDCYKQWVA